jgi:hypothetical protein
MFAMGILVRQQSRRVKRDLGYVLNIHSGDDGIRSCEHGEHGEHGALDLACLRVYGTHMAEMETDDQLGQALKEWLRQGTELRDRLTEERRVVAARLAEIDRQLAAIPKISEADGSQQNAVRSHTPSDDKKPTPAVVEAAQLVALAARPVDRAWLAKELKTNKNAAGTRLIRALSAGLIRRGPVKGTFMAA